jgi:hypothetical protein
MANEWLYRVLLKEVMLMEELENNNSAAYFPVGEEKLGRLSPLWYERLYSLPAEAKSKRDLKILAYWLFIMHGRKMCAQLRYIENLVFQLAGIWCAPLGTKTPGGRRSPGGRGAT